CMRLLLAEATQLGDGCELTHARFGLLVLPVVDRLAADADQQTHLVGGEAEAFAQRAETLGDETKVRTFVRLCFDPGCRLVATLHIGDLLFERGDLALERSDLMALRRCRRPQRSKVLAHNLAGEP